MGSFWPKGGRAKTFLNSGFEFGDGVQFPATTNNLYVTKFGDDTNGDGSVVKPFLTVSKAITTAIAGVVIKVAPGTYVEDLTMKAGVHLIADVKYSTYITGVVTCSYTGTVVCENFQFQRSTAGNVIAFNGATVQKLILFGCAINSTVANASNVIELNNTNAGSILQLTECTVTNVNSTLGNKAINSLITDKTNVVVENTSITVSDNMNNIAVNLDGLTNYSHVQDQIRGRVVVSTGAQALIAMCSLYSVTLACLTTNSAGVSSLSNCILFSTANPIVAGAGVFGYGGIAYGTTGQNFAGTLNGGAGAIGLKIESHKDLMGLATDDHTQYALLVGRAGGQALKGGTAASENLALSSTSNATKGFISMDGVKFSRGAGSPEGVVTGNPGDMYADTTNGSLYIKNTGAGNTGWVVLAGAAPSEQPGDIFISGAATRTGCYFCDGSLKTVAGDPTLYAAIGTSFNTGGETPGVTFRIPDGRNAFPRGAGTSVLFAQNGTVTLGAYQDDAAQDHLHPMPHDHSMAHNHLVANYTNDTFADVAAPARTPSYIGDGFATYNPQYTGGSSAANTGAESTPNTGAGSTLGYRTANETRPNNFGVNFFIKF